MRVTVFLLLLVSVVQLVDLLPVRGADCNVPDSNKIDCGFSGIEKAGCVAKGCCWQEVNPNPGNVPWCFYQSGANPCPFISANSTAQAPFSTQELETMTSLFMANININGSGGVVASPDKNTPGGSYYYAWERDGALSMHALFELSTGKGGWVPQSVMQKNMQAYVQWVIGRQNLVDPHGIDVRTEPKYMLPGGAVFPGGWCRPQTDGPGLRAHTLTAYANYLLDNGQADYVKQYLYTGAGGAHFGGAIKHDLDWVAANWTQNGCDLWEEIRSDDFFWGRYNFKRALLEGADLAARLGDAASAATYRAAGLAVNATLGAHFNGEYIFETEARPRDSAVICGLNDGYYAGDGLFHPTSGAVANTIKSYNDLFCLAFPINQADNQAGVPGMLYGRYGGDHYAGGNPWILSSGALAELFYRGAVATLTSNQLPEDDVLSAWRSTLPSARLPESNVDISVSTFAEALLAAGDGVLQRIKNHVSASGFHLSEQLDKNTGEEMSATDLTWSYAAVLKAALRRSQVQAAMKELNS